MSWRRKKLDYVRLMWRRRHVWRLGRRKKKIRFFSFLHYAARCTRLPVTMKFLCEWQSRTSSSRAAAATTTWSSSSGSRDRSQSRKRNSKITAMRQMKRLWKKTTKRRRRNRPTEREKESVNERAQLRKRQRKRMQIKVREQRAKATQCEKRLITNVQSERNETQPGKTVWNGYVAECERARKRANCCAHTKRLNWANKRNATKRRRPRIPKAKEFLPFLFLFYFLLIFFFQAYLTSIFVVNKAKRNTTRKSKLQGNIKMPVALLEATLFLFLLLLLLPLLLLLLLLLCWSSILSRTHNHLPHMYIFMSRCKLCW